MVTKEMSAIGINAVNKEANKEVEEASQVEVPFISEMDTMCSAMEKDREEKERFVAEAIIQYMQTLKAARRMGVHIGELPLSNEYEFNGVTHVIESLMDLSKREIEHFSILQYATNPYNGPIYYLSIRTKTVTIEERRKSFWSRKPLKKEYVSYGEAIRISVFCNGNGRKTKMEYTETHIVDYDLIIPTCRLLLENTVILHRAAKEKFYEWSNNKDEFENVKKEVEEHGKVFAELLDM